MGEANETATVEVSAKVQKILDQVSELTLMEASELVKAFEEKFGVSAAPVAAVAAVAAAPEEAAEEIVACLPEPYIVEMVDAIGVLLSQ